MNDLSQKISKNVLIVDDDSSVREIVALSLELDGYSALQAENGEVALQLLSRLDKNSLPAFILLDLMMPVMDGKTFINLIHTLPEFNQIPIIICSARGSYEPTSQIISKITKPIDLNTLNMTINKCLNSFTEEMSLIY